MTMTGTLGIPEPSTPRARPTMPSATLFLVAILIGFGTNAGALAAQASSDLRTLQTRPERTGWMETSSYRDVVDFVERVVATDARMHLTTFGYSSEGRPLPLVIVGTGLTDGSAEAIAATGKLRVWIQANIHGGEVEGKEAMQRMLREIALGSHASWLETMVLLVAPIYNADGNERVSLTGRGPQHGPLGGTGQRPNAQGYDLNRDHMKLDSPEARSLIGAMNEYDPHLFMDLHATNGTRHAYHLTYSPPLHPDTPVEISDFLWNELLPDITETMLEKDGWHFYHYGNASGQGESRGWRTFDYRPRFNTNYIGLRNRPAILSEAYAYLPFREREVVTYRFVEEILDYIRPRAAEIRAMVERADAEPLIGTELSTSSRLRPTPGRVEILMGETEIERHPFTGGRLERRRDVVILEMMLEAIAYEAATTERVPAAYFVPPNVAPAIERLAAHGVRTTTLDAERTLRAEVFHIDETTAATNPFQGRNERSVVGRYVEEEVVLPAGTVVVSMDQPLARLVFHLLEPTAADGLVNWAILDAFVEAGERYPIARTHDRVMAR